MDENIYQIYLCNSCFQKHSINILFHRMNAKYFVLTYYNKNQ